MMSWFFVEKQLCFLCVLCLFFAAAQEVIEVRVVVSFSCSFSSEGCFLLTQQVLSAFSESLLLLFVMGLQGSFLLRAYLKGIHTAPWEGGCTYPIF